MENFGVMPSKKKDDSKQAPTLEKKDAKID